MPKSSNQKLKLIYLMKILLERTDETHGITMSEIIDGIFGTSSADSAASKLCACAPDSSSSYSYYETLRDKINAS